MLAYLQAMQVLMLLFPSPGVGGGRTARFIPSFTWPLCESAVAPVDGDTLLTGSFLCSQKVNSENCAVNFHVPRTVWVLKMEESRQEASALMMHVCIH